jgi:hypothetical protein
MQSEKPKQRTWRKKQDRLSLHPLSVEEALAGAMQTGKAPEPQNKHAKRATTKWRVKGETKD